jgi:hypothetical protein
MANYIKIRDLDSYSTNAAGAVTGIYTGDYMALASRLPSNGGLESVQNTRRATIADTIRLYNEAQTIADAVAASVAAGNNQSADQIAQDLANISVQLPSPMLTTAWDPTLNGGDGACGVSNDPSLTARTFGSVIALGQGLSYTATPVEGSADAEGCSDYTYSLGLTPVTDVTATTFILFVGRNETLDDANNYPMGGYAAGDNALTDATPGEPGTGNYLLRGSGRGASEITYQQPTWRDATVLPTIDSHALRALIDTTQVLESGVTGDLGTLKSALSQVHGYSSFQSAKCVANPFVSINEAVGYATNNFDLASSTIIYWIRGEDNCVSYADRSAIYNTPGGMNHFNHRRNYIVSPVAGKPRKINYDLGLEIKSDNQGTPNLNWSPVPPANLICTFGAGNNNSAITNVWFKYVGVGASQAIRTANNYLFRYAGGHTNWDNSIIDWSDTSNEHGWDGAVSAVSFALVHQNYNDSTLGFEAHFWLRSHGMYDSLLNIPHLVLNYPDYSRFRPGIEYITNRRVRIGQLFNNNGPCLMRLYSFNMNNFSVGGLDAANWKSSNVSSMHRFRDGTAGAKLGFQFNNLFALDGGTEVLQANSILAESKEYVDASYTAYGCLGVNGACNLMVYGNATIWPKEPTAGDGFGNTADTLLYSDTAVNVDGHLSYRSPSAFSTGRAPDGEDWNYLDSNAALGTITTIRVASPDTPIGTSASSLIYYPAAPITESPSTEGWLGRITGGYGRTCLVGVSGVPGASPPSGTGPLQLYGGENLRTIDSASTTNRTPLFTGMYAVSNSLYKYIDDPWTAL